MSSNPLPIGHTDLEVGKTSKQNWGVTYGGITLNLEPVDEDNAQIVFDGVNSPQGKLFTMQVLSPRDPASLYSNPSAETGEVAQPIGPMKITLKLEPVPGKGTAQERTYTLKKVNEWEEAEFDFNGVGINQFHGMTLIIDSGYLPDNVPNNWTLYFDEIQQSKSTTTVADLSDFNGSPVVFDFDQLEDFVYPAPTSFQGARSDIRVDPVTPVDPQGNNNYVGRVYYDVNEGGPNSRGVTLVGSAEGFPTAIPFDVNGGRTTISIRVNTPEANTPVLLKVEDAQNPNRFAEVTQITTQAGWQTLTFDFSNIESGFTFEKLGIIFDPTACIYNAEFDPNCPTQPREQTYYFDDIQLLR